ncbi:MAG: DUF2242 domain-containing protein [Burkholderiaceae bacterium]
MDLRFRSWRLPLAALPTLALCACMTSSPTPFHREAFAPSDTYSRIFAAPEAQTCEAARRALLSQGYLISMATSDQVGGRKSFQPGLETHIQIEFRISCARESERSTIAFVSALQDRYALKKSNNSASLGVGAIGSLSLPFTSSDEALVKVASETVTAAQFYDRFFELMEQYLIVDPESELERPSASPVPSPSPAPPPVPPPPGSSASAAPG